MFCIFFLDIFKANFVAIDIFLLPFNPTIVFSLSFYSFIFMILCIMSFLKRKAHWDFHLMTAAKLPLKCIFFLDLYCVFSSLQLNGFLICYKCSLMCNLTFITYFKSFVSNKELRWQLKLVPSNLCPIISRKCLCK